MDSRKMMQDGQKVSPHKQSLSPVNLALPLHLGQFSPNLPYGSDLLNVERPQDFLC